MASTVASSPSLLNGERAVVLVFVGSVISRLPFALLLHGISLFLLGFAAMFIEIRAESCDLALRFKTRPGASSGILLGAVTLPTLMISKLIQISRAYGLSEVGLEEIDYLKFQYCVTSASCFSVLVFLLFIMRQSPNSSNTSFARASWDAKLKFGFAVFFAGLNCVSLATESHSGFLSVIKFLWLLCHGWAAVKLIQHLMDTFPSCASIGEALLVTSGLVLYFGDMLTYTIGKVHEKFMSTAQVSVLYHIKRSEISIIIQGLLLGLLIFPVAFKFILQIWEHYLNKSESEARRQNDLGRSLVFFASFGLILVVIAPSWMQFVHDFHEHPLLWVFIFVFSEPLKRISLCIYWVGLVYLSAMRFYDISKNSKIERILLRKYYHLMAVSMFVPALIFQPKFLDLAFGAALAVFLALEIIRVWRIWPLGQQIHQFMNAFTDHRDSDILIVSHFSLLLGCALPIWMNSGYNDRPLAPFAGILSLGIGDTMASVVGHKYGVLRWSKTGKKTIEGTAAGITSVLAACSVLLPLLASTRYILSQHWFSLLLSVFVSGLLEAYTAQLDNAFIPLVFYSLLCL